MVNTSNETDASSSEIVNQAETSSIVSEDQTPLVENGHDKQLRTVRMKRSQQNMDQRRMNMFLDPMMEELEKAMADNMKQLEKFEEELLGDGKKALAEKYNPVGHLPPEIREGKSVEKVMENFENMLTASIDAYNNSKSGTDGIDPCHKQALDSIQNKTNGSNGLAHVNDNDDELPKSAEIRHLACLAQVLTGYLITINSKRNSDRLKAITAKLYDSVNLWLSRLFRFHDSSIIFHDQETEGFVRMCNLMMNYKYAEFKKLGYTAIKRQPTIYVSAASKYARDEFKEQVAVQLGIPIESIRTARVSKRVDYTLDKIDPYYLNEQIEEDIKEGYVPLAIVANVGSHDIGQCDEIQQLNDLCVKFRMWIHLEGIYLPTLAMYSVPSVVQPVWSGDSVTLNIPLWLGIPSLSYVTIYRNAEKSSQHLQLYNSNYISILHKCLPYWCVLQGLGHNGVVQRIKYANDMSVLVNNILEKHKPFLKVLNFKHKKPVTTTNYTLSDLFVQALSFLTFVDLNNPVLLFKCDQKYIYERLNLFMGLESENQASKPAAAAPKKKRDPVHEEFVKIMNQREPFFPQDFKKIEQEEQAKKEAEKKYYAKDIMEYTDTLTSWLCDLINSLHKKLDFELIHIQNEGFCIRYCPLDHVNIFGTQRSDLVNFEKSLQDIMTVLDASIKCKSQFERQIREHTKNLVVVPVSKWAGIGAVRYVPDDLLDKLNSIYEYQEEKNKFNEKKQADQSEKESLNQAQGEFGPLDTEKSENGQEKSQEQPVVSETVAPEETKQPDDVFVEDAQIERYIKQINSLNEKLVKKLQAQDGAFSLDQGDDLMNVVKFGMVNELDIVKSLALEVQEVGKSVEEDSKFVEVMSSVVKAGIEKANEDLRKEMEQKAMQQSLLRQIPLVNGFFNWFTPAQNNSTGRTFNLQSGKIASTDVIYKYHMQVEEIDEQKKPQETNEDTISQKSSSHVRNSSTASSSKSIIINTDSEESKNESKEMKQ